ncbi:unnamed protein product [Phaedon cochleariae]|uniref:DUF4806 domain-containing protein n=1 Tax=Phaedon cochleariae TaxID=80249 RepID=A0A9P0DUB3_PHACE|nr:unnamed protein product [Phaedon cochleariae]
MSALNFIAALCRQSLVSYVWLAPLLKYFCCVGTIGTCTHALSQPQRNIVLFSLHTFQHSNGRHCVLFDVNIVVVCCLVVVIQDFKLLWICVQFSCGIIGILHIMEENKYLVVEFPEETDENGTVTMSIISSSWLFEKNGCLYCHWPAYFKSDIIKDKAIQSHLVLIEDKCVVCPIRVKYSTDDFYRARKKLQHLEVESQTESENEQKRVPKKPIYKDYEQFSEDSNDHVPIIPLPKKQIFTPLTNVDIGTSVSKRKITVPKPTTKSKLEDDVESLGEAASISQASDGSSSLRSCISCQENKALITEILRQLQINKEDLSYLIRLTKGKSESNVPIPIEFTQIKEFNELILFNNSLNEDSKFAEACNNFQFVGGKDVPDTTRRILNRLMSNDLAITTNWTGRNNKNGFIDMKNIIKLIHVSVRNNPLIQPPTLDEVENLIKGWLRSATDREGGRARRFLKK